MSSKGIGQIFDSNFPHALPVDKKSFDLCCSTDEIQQSFVKFHKLHTYPHFHKALKDMKPGNPQGKKKKRKRKSVYSMKKWIFDLNFKHKFLVHELFCLFLMHQPSNYSSRKRLGHFSKSITSTRNWLLH